MISLNIIRRCSLRAPRNGPAAMPVEHWLIVCDVPTVTVRHGTNVGAARLAGQKARYTAWSLNKMRDGARSHGTAANPDPLLGGLSNVEIDLLAAHLASLP
jgi:hypothetical protein